MVSTRIQPVAIGAFDAQLQALHEPGASAAIWARTPDAALLNEVQALLNDPVFGQVSLTAAADQVAEGLAATGQMEQYPALRADMSRLAALFSDLTQSPAVRISLSRVKDDMCRKFHTDVTDYRLLCGYAGPGTLYVAPDTLPQPLPEDFEPAAWSQLESGHVMIFRGALSATAACPALLHRSPTLSDTAAERLLLRIDTNQFGWHSH